MIYLIGIGPGDPELLTLKAARLLKEVDIIYVPQSNSEGRSIAENIIKIHADPNKIHPVTISMRSQERGTDPIYACLAKEISDYVNSGLKIAYVSLGDTLLYSTAQYLGLELDKLGLSYTYVPGVPAVIAAASYKKVHLAAGNEGLILHVMPDSLEKLVELTAFGNTLALMKVHKFINVLIEYIRLYKPARAVLLHRIGLDGERAYELTELSEVPEDIGYLSLAIIQQGK